MTEALFASVDVEMMPAADVVWQPGDDMTKALPIKLMVSHAVWRR